MPSVVAQLENVSRLFGRFPALRQISAIFEAGRCYVLLGENGAGKSTLLRVLAGLLEPTSGTVRVFPGEGRQNCGRDWRCRVGYMSHASMLYDELSAVENLRYFAHLYRSTEPPAGHPAAECLTPEGALQSVGLDPELRRPVGKYSQGMRQRASLARVLLSRPDLVLLDEPFSNMDAASVRHMMELLDRMRTEGRTILLTTHQRELALPLADSLLTLQAGRLVSFVPGPASATAGKIEVQRP